MSSPKKFDASKINLRNRLTAILSKFPLPLHNGSLVKCAYGTSGIRTNHTLLDNAVVKCALFQILLSATMKKGKALGLIITASHNPADDNGIKLCEDDGSPLDQKWENILEKVVDQAPSEAVSTLFEIFLLHRVSESEENKSKIAEIGQKKPKIAKAHQIKKNLTKRKKLTNMGKK